MSTPGYRSGSETTTGSSATDRHSSGDVLIPILDDGVNEQVLGVAAALARHRNGGLLLMKAVALPRVLPFDAYEDCVDRDRDREVLQSALQAAGDLDVRIRGITRIGRSTAAIVLRSIEEHWIDAVVLESTEQIGSFGVFHRDPLVRIAANAKCDVLVIQGGSDRPEISSLLLPITGWPHAQFAADVAYALAAEHDSTVDIVYVLDTDASERAYERAWDTVSACLGHLDGLDNVTIRVSEKDHVASTIGDRALEYDLTVLETSRVRGLRAVVRNSVPRTINEESRTTVLIAQHPSNDLLDR